MNPIHVTMCLVHGIPETDGTKILRVIHLNRLRRFSGVSVLRLHIITALIASNNEEQALVISSL